MVHMEDRIWLIINFVTKSKKRETIKVFNKGKHKRSFTYIDDAINNLYEILKKSSKINSKNHQF